MLKPNAISYLSAIMAVIALARTSCALSGEGADSTKPAEAQKVTINGFFGGKSHSTDEIRDRAVNEIKRRGYAPVSAGECVINFVLDPSVMCVVILSEGLGKKLQVVKFDGKGGVLEVYSGVGKDGVPPKGANPMDSLPPRELRKAKDP